MCEDILFQSILKILNFVTFLISTNFLVFFVLSHPLNHWVFLNKQIQENIFEIKKW